MCGGDCGREGRKYKAPLSTRRKGKGIGRFRKLPSEILPGGKRALPPPGGPGLPAFLSSLLGSGEWGVGSDRPRHLSGTQHPHPHNTEDFQHFLSPSSSSHPGRRAGSGARPRQGALKARRLRNRPPAQGTAHASPGPPRTGRPVGSQTGSPPPPPALMSPATERKSKFTALKQLP